MTRSKHLSNVTIHTHPNRLHPPLTPTINLVSTYNLHTANDTKEHWRTILSNLYTMFKKKILFSLLCIFFTSMFIARFFQIISFPILLIGLLAFISILVRWLTDIPKLIWRRNKRVVVVVWVALTIVIARAQNSIMAMSFLILMVGIFYTFHDIDYHKNKVVHFTIWSYSILGALSLSYFLWFATAASLVWSHDINDFECNDIYKYYNLISTRAAKKDTNSIQYATYPLSWSQKTSLSLKEILKDTPWLQALYHKVKLYGQDIRSGITDQQQINKEVCQLVTQRVHDVYQSDNIKIWLILIIWLFLYPFFALLLYLYGFIAYRSLRGMVWLWWFTFTTKKLEVTRIQ